MAEINDKRDVSLVADMETWKENMFVRKIGKTIERMYNKVTG